MTIRGKLITALTGLIALCGYIFNLVPNYQAQEAERSWRNILIPLIERHAKVVEIRRAMDDYQNIRCAELAPNDLPELKERALLLVDGRSFSGFLESTEIGALVILDREGRAKALNIKRTEYGL